MDVVRLLTGDANPGIEAPISRAMVPGAGYAGTDVQDESSWEDVQARPESSGHTKKLVEDDDDGELSRLLKTVRERRTSRTRAAKRKSS